MDLSPTMLLSWRSVDWDDPKPIPKTGMVFYTSCVLFVIFTVKFISQEVCGF